MKILALPLCVFLLLLDSCSENESSSKPASFRPLQNGFGVVVQPMGVDSGPGAKLFYKGTNEMPVLVWPYIGTAGDPILFSNDIALLHADKPDSNGYLGNNALIADQGVGPAMDISDDVLEIAALQSHLDFATALKDYEFYSLNQTNGKVEVCYYVRYGLHGPDAKANLTWDEISNLIRDVKITGKTNKVVNTDVIYLQRKY
jgi:hypothetical protein